MRGEKSRLGKWLIGDKKKKNTSWKKTWEHSFKFMAGKISFVESS